MAFRVEVRIFYRVAGKKVLAEQAEQRRQQNVARESGETQ